MAGTAVRAVGMAERWVALMAGTAVSACAQAAPVESRSWPGPRWWRVPRQGALNRARGPTAVITLGPRKGFHRAAPKDPDGTLRCG